MMIRDPFHRAWNGARNGVADAGLWSVILLTSVTYNLQYGPWEGSGWRAKQVEAAARFLEEATPADLLFGSLFDSICRDRGLQPTGSLEEKRALLNSLPAADFLQTKKGAQGCPEPLVCMDEI